jgi:hypothetical protein
VGILDVELADAIHDGISPLLPEVTYVASTPGSYDPATGDVAHTEGTSYTGKGFHDEEIGRYREDGLVGDVEAVVIIITKSLAVEPRTGGRVTVGAVTVGSVTVAAKTYTIASVKRDPATAHWVLGVNS